MESIQRYEFIEGLLLLALTDSPHPIFVLHVVPSVRCWAYSRNSPPSRLFHLHAAPQAFYIIFLCQRTMQHRDKIIEYFRSGRYECDYQFHVQLHQLLQEMNLYQWLPYVENQMHSLKRIKELTQINSKSLDEEYDEEEGVCQTYKIRSLINQLNSKEIPIIIKQCESLSWQPYSVKICALLEGKTDYENILQRIHTTIHSQQFRIDSMLFTAFFESINGGKLNYCIATYTQTIEYFLNFLTNQRKRFEVLIQAEEYSNIGRLKRVRQYVGTLYFIVRTCIRYCEIVKILTGKNNLSLKFTVVKKEIDKLMKQYPEWKFQAEKEDLFKILPVFKDYLKTGHSFNKQKICCWCFKELKNEVGCHSFCNTLINKKQQFK